MHSLQIIELQSCEKERHTLPCILELYTNIVHEFYCRLHSEFTNWSGHDNNIKQSAFEALPKKGSV